MTWYYSPDGVQRLEVSDAVLVSLARDGRLRRDMLLWRDGLPDWRPAGEVRPDLFGNADVAAVPTPSSGSESEGTPPGALVVAPSAAYLPPPPPMYQRPMNSTALTSVISGGVGLIGSVSGFCCCFGSIIAPVAALVAVIFGHMAYSAAKGHPEAERDKTMAVIGLCLGYLTLAILVGWVIFTVLAIGVSAMAEMAKGASPF